MMAGLAFTANTVRVQAADASADQGGIGDIVVNSQRLQDVPVSVAAADATALASIGIQAPPISSV